MTTFYMVEMHYPATEDRRRFDDFYDKHITMLLTIKGFLSAQRYECIHDARAPFLAIYRLTEPGVMTSENYTSKAGRNSVDPVFRAKMTNWDRNLVQGDIASMDVADGGHLVLIDRLSAGSPPLPDGFTSLSVVGLDATIVERGVRILGKGEALPDLKATDGWAVRTFRPIHPVRYPA